MNYTVEYGGERLDRIAKKLYGTELNGAVEALLDANQGLALLCYPSAIVPENTVIIVPDFKPAPRNDGIVLPWE